MTLDELLSLWERDSNIDKTELGEESLRCSILHHRYWKLYAKEREILRKEQAKLKKLRLAKKNFYVEGPSVESREMGWVYPGGKILKTEAQEYVDADPAVISLAQTTGLQQEKVDFLDSVIKHIRDRNFAIKTALDWCKFVNGG